MGLFSKIGSGLKKTRESFMGALNGLISSFTKIDEDFFEELEEILVMADVGVMTADYICTELRQKVKQERVTDTEQIIAFLKQILTDILGQDNCLKLNTKPSVLVVIGVNGAGKTTSVGKMAARFKLEGKSVLLGAADTFRAGAIEQLDVWAKRTDVPIVKSFEGSDPASVVFDTVSSGKARGSDIIICDTAGRLHNKKNLMDELAKIMRIIRRELPDADIETLLVLDATTGQNAVNQAKEFSKVGDISGIVLTKLDGTAKGGVVVTIKHELGMPVKFIGVGEGVDDLQPFDATEFVDGIFEG